MDGVRLLGVRRVRVWLVKVVRLPDPDDKGSQYLDLWDRVKDAKTPQEYILGCKGAIDTIYSSWKQDFSDWTSKWSSRARSTPVLLCVADNAKRAAGCLITS